MYLSYQLIQPNFMKQLFFLLLVASTMLMSSCITVSESYTFKKNGSGSMEYFVDAREFMAQVGTLLSAQGDAPNSENPLGESFSTAKMGEKLKNIKGISGIKVEEDGKKGIFKLNFKFKNIQTLNDALNQMLNSKEEGAAYHTYFTKNGNEITRSQAPKAGMSVADLVGEEGGENEQYAITMLEGMKYKIGMKFASDVQAAYISNDNSNEELKIEGNEVKIQANFKEITELGSQVLDSRVILK